MHLPLIFKNVINDAKKFHDVKEAFKHCQDLYSNQTRSLVEMVDNKNHQKEINYPYIGIYKKTSNNQEEFYGNTITQALILGNSYLEKLQNIVKEKGEYEIWVGYSFYPMSLAFVCEDSFNNLSVDKKLNINMPCISRIRKGMKEISQSKIKPIGFFHAEHIDYSLNRIYHYCGSHAKDFQKNIIFTNYKMYIDFFVEDGKKWVDNGDYESIVGPDLEYSKCSVNVIDNCSMPQMPTYHLKKKNGNGITIINFGVGPTNTKNITDSLAVLSPNSWLMLGHCAGLKTDQKLGDYVLAQNYARYDHILDQHVSNKIPIPSSAKITENLEQNVIKYKLNGEKVHKGTIATTADRNWELDCDMVQEFVESQAIAVDMESATMSTNAFRFSVPCSAFLCISDMPIHGKIKLRAMAKNFYQTKVRHHFNIGISAIKNLYED